ncbi:MAG: flagellar motor protein MotS [Alphaproteobacteria bacterium ADurb.Bin438]|nr:MAG: flagellar motor protein MotS [Alphaproteobacteria bacterium ADurb.Bin438]
MNHNFKENGFYDNALDLNKAESYDRYWYITFSDLMSLMVAFFVMLYGMSSPKEESFRYLSQSIEQKKLEDKNPIGKQASQYGLNRTFSKRGVSLPYLEAVFSSKISENEIFKNVKLTKVVNGLAISLSAEEIFNIKNGIVEIKSEKESLIFEISDMMQNIKNKVKIVGYAKNKDLSENYNLALTFASSLRYMLKEKGYKENMDLLIYGDDTIFERLDVKEVVKDAYVNRVDILIMSDGQDL